MNIEYRHAAKTKMTSAATESQNRVETDRRAPFKLLVILTPSAAESCEALGTERSSNSPLPNAGVDEMVDFSEAVASGTTGARPEIVFARERGVEGAAVLRVRGVDGMKMVSKQRVAEKTVVAL